MDTVLHFFPDTNLFIQCRPLAELEWTLWKDYDEIRLVVTRPVQREIDNQKSKGKGRVNKRARSTASLFKEIITGADGYRIVREEEPRVLLVVSPEYLPDPALSGQLDYGERDDQLVGTVSAFIQDSPDAAARLLTHDSGPLASAKMVGVPFTPIPDDWLLEPEGTESEKAIRNLEGQIAKLKATEPRFTIRCVDADGSAAEKLEFHITRYEPLSDEEIAALMSDIRAAFPEETDFGSPEPDERDSLQKDAFRILGLKQVYEPADSDDIKAYREERYPQWLEKCEEILRTLHVALEQCEDIPAFCFVARNEGTRPARDALVTIEALGRFQIIPPGRDDDDDDVGDQRRTSIAALPSPPKAPKGQWLQSIGGTSHHLAQLQRSMARSLAGLDPPRFASAHPYMPSLAALHPQRHDPNAFYYKPARPMRTGSAFSLKCDQWRHGDGVDPELFCCEIHVPPNEANVSGALECRIHAENLSETVSLRVPIRVSVQTVRVLGRAQELISALRMANPGSAAGP